MARCRTRAWLRGPALLVLLILGCGYTSAYAPPLDGRARPVWRQNNVVLETSGLRPTPECWRLLLEMTNTAVARQPKEYGLVRRPDDGYWVPRYYGAPIVVVSPGLVPVLPHPPLFMPVPLPGLVAPGISFVGPVPVPGLRLNSGGDSGKALVVLAVIALLALPAVDLALALAPPESPTRSSQAIDQVNLLNDLMRSPGNACSYEVLSGGAP